ncbi:MAG: DNA-processing protein DprA, partial [Paludibacteraceae bacterium]|nr:DNA-processing protein DprA [Paludibacteraceae bacterium]
IMLYTKGNSNLNAKRFVGIVGTRDATEYGKANCIKLIQELAALTPELTIVSGLAYGIDICAHKTALESDLPTIGVVGHGLDRIYPATHRSTAVKMLEKGALVTEYLTETNPDRQNFVQRNRVIAGMCDAIVVVESGVKGGSLITAEMAQSYNRDVFAFPGRVNDTQSAGCNALIKNNKAGLIETATDLVNAMCWEMNKQNKTTIQTTLFNELTELQQRIITLIKKNENISLNEISLNLGLAVNKTSVMMLELEFMGVIGCLPGNRYKIYF